MFKLKHKAYFLALIVVVFCFTCFTVSANPVVKSQSIPNEFSFEMQFGDSELEYLYSLDNHGNLMADSSSAVIQSKQYNIYIDENRREYTFKLGENTPCAIQEEMFYGIPTDTIVTEQQAINSARAYLTPLISNLSAYTLLSSDYYEQDAVFCIRYGYKKYSYWTDDVIAVFVKADGQVGGYSAYQLGAFVDREASSYKLEEAENALATLVNEYQAEIILCGIVFDEEDKLSLAAAIKIDNETGLQYFSLE